MGLITVDSIHELLHAPSKYSINTQVLHTGEHDAIQSTERLSMRCFSLGVLVVLVIALGLFSAMQWQLLAVRISRVFHACFTRVLRVFGLKPDQIDRSLGALLVVVLGTRTIV